MKIALIVQRYGDRCVGGAEHHARLLANQLKLSHQVEVFTTTAVDYQTWKNELPSGKDSLDGITISRFHTFWPRWPKFFQLFNRVVQKLSNVSKTNSFFHLPFVFLQTLWFYFQGPFTPTLKKELLRRSEEFDLMVFFTYLYYPTVRILPKIADKSILIPTAHDEPPFYFPDVHQLFQKTKAIIVNTQAEKRLIERVHSPINAEITVGAMGIDQSKDSNSLKTEQISSSYLLYLGRIGHAKSTGEIIDFMISRWDKGHKDLSLYLAGGVEEGFEVAKHPAIMYFGFVTDEKKEDLITNALAIVNPSRFESLSIIALEGILAKKQLILNTHCEVLLDYVRALPTAYGYDSKESFEDILTNVLVYPDHLAALENELEKAKSWVVQQFSWKRVVHNIEMMASKLKA